MPGRRRRISRIALILMAVLSLAVCVATPWLYLLGWQVTIWDLWRDEPYWPRLVHPLYDHGLDYVVDWWCISALAAVLPVLWIRSERRRRRRLLAGLCPRCRYDLTGNVSGVCPECGTPVSPAAPGRGNAWARTFGRRR